MGNTYREMEYSCQFHRRKAGKFEPVNTDLDDYLTNKALSGMFLKVEDEELKIRKEVRKSNSAVAESFRVDLGNNKLTVFQEYVRKDNF